MSDESIKQPPSDERTETDSTGEFFSVGAPLHAVRAGYVRRKADKLLYDTVVSGRYAHVLAPDRSGKSSLVAAVTAQLEANGSKVAILDLAQIASAMAAETRAGGITTSPTGSCANCASDTTCRPGGMTSRF